MQRTLATMIGGMMGTGLSICAGGPGSGPRPGESHPHTGKAARRRNELRRMDSLMDYQSYKSLGSEPAGYKYARGSNVIHIDPISQAWVHTAKGRVEGLGQGHSSLESHLFAVHGWPEYESANSAS